MYSHGVTTSDGTLESAIQGLSGHIASPGSFSGPPPNRLVNGSGVVERFCSERYVHHPAIPCCDGGSAVASVASATVVVDGYTALNEPT